MADDQACCPCPRVHRCRNEELTIPVGATLTGSSAFYSVWDARHLPFLPRKVAVVLSTLVLCHRADCHGHGPRPAILSFLSKGITVRAACAGGYPARSAGPRLCGQAPKGVAGGCAGQGPLE